MRLSAEWFTAAELASLAMPEMPTTTANVLVLAEREGWKSPSYAGKKWRRRAGRGGGIEFHWSLLPPDARLQWAAMHPSVPDAEKDEKSDPGLWEWFAEQNDNAKDEAERRLRAVKLYFDMIDNSDEPKTNIAPRVYTAFNTGRSAFYNWLSAIEGHPRSDWLPALAPRYKGRTNTAECSQEAWDFLYVEYARKSKPTFAYAYGRLADAAKEHGWVIPSEATLLRRMQKVDRRQLILARDGEDALRRTVAPVKRDKEVYHALQAVNADGHKFDDKVEWEDGVVGRPMVVCFQDIYSGKFLSWRIGRTESTNVIRLAFGDMIEKWGIPEHCFLDNGKAFASKQMTGGTEKRFRGKVREEDPEGIMVRLGVHVHFTTPYSGQSKPIERGFGDFARDIAKDARLEGAYLGNNPLKKPANYGERIAPIALFRQVLDEGIARHNARLGRRSDVCKGKFSFDDVFQKSYEQAKIQKVVPGQRQIWLPVANNIQVRGPYGFLEFKKNKYEADFLVDLIGKSVSIRFDPDALHEDLYVYRENGSFLGMVPCTKADGFDSLDAAEKIAKRKADVRRRARELDEASRKLTTEEHLALTAREPLPDADAEPEARVIKPMFGRGRTALARKPDIDAEDEEMSAFDKAFVQHARAARVARGDHLRVVEEED